MKNISQSAFCFILLFVMSNEISAQRVQIDSTTTIENIDFAIVSDSVLVDELLYGNEKEALVITKSEKRAYINKPKAKEKKFVSAEEK